MSPGFKIIYSTHFKKVYSICLLILRNPHLAEEAAQDTFFKVYKGIDKLQDLTKLEGWLKVIATNTAIDIYRANKKIVTIEHHEVLDYFVNKCHNEHDPFIDVERAEINKDVRQAISKLNPPLDQLIILKYYVELKDQEIADTLNMPLGTVKTNLYKARKTLLRLLPSINKDFLHFIKGAK